LIPYRQLTETSSVVQIYKRLVTTNEAGKVSQDRSQSSKSRLLCDVSDGRGVGFKKVVSGNPIQFNFFQGVIMSSKKNIDRRQFLGGAATAAAAFTIVPRHVLGGAGHTPPSETLNIAGIGVGNMGANNLHNCEGENIIALCDVDDEYAAKTYEKYPNARKYGDYRVMFDKQKDIDAVIIATPDHSHAIIAMDAMRRGKHLYCQKPMTYTVHEARMLTEAARKHKVATQMGNQGHSGEGIRLIKEWIADGAIGKVGQVDCWTDRPFWPVGSDLDRPTETPPVPSTLDWDKGIGPAPMRPYHPKYLPIIWRAWWDFGTGALGDMGCHIIDIPFWSLDLGYPISVEACSPKCWSSWDNMARKYEMFPRSSVVRYKFPARGDKPAVTLNWYDGGLRPERPEELEPNRRMGDYAGGDREGSGTIFIGDKGKIMCGVYGGSPRLIPETAMKAYKLPAKTFERIPAGSHEKDWIRACKGGKPACSNFDYAGPLTETVLLGNVAMRMDTKLDWDGENLKVLNVPKANEFIHRQYRQGWTL